MSAYGSAEEWAQSARFSQPVRLGEVEQGILARRPVEAPRSPWWVFLVGAVGWAAMAFAFIIGPGVSMLGALLVWLGWLAAARWVFLLGALAYGFYVVELVKARRRRLADQACATLTLVGCLAAELLLRGEMSTELPRGLRPLVWTLALVAAAIVVISFASKPQGAASAVPSTRRPPRRGPDDEKEYERYLHTRKQVLDILVRRGLVHVDPMEQGRLNSMPLGYWEELDGVDERQRRHILEYATIGWREFSASDRRPWSPPSTGTHHDT